MKVNLRLEVKENDANKIIRWLKDENITKYLNEDIASIDSLESVIKNKQADLLTYYLNQCGRFFLIDSTEEKCIGFLNLFPYIPNKEYEIVIAIGDERNWGKQYGKDTIISIMREVFLKWRIKKVFAKVHIDNKRSIEMFEHLNFINEGVKNNHYIYSMDFDTYLKSLSEK
ncbi:MAG: GNAT family protein [Bacilli bacterium]|jgi:RimJ/RimL family protein N-acetyltransferase